MNITLKNCCMVKPANRTWTGLLPLTESDQTGVLTHVPTIYFYRTQKTSPDIDAIIPTLAASLSRVLVHFYPLAGRLHPLDGGRFELNCNNDGVKFIEAECQNEMEKLGDFTPCPEFHHLIPKIDYSVAIEEIPLLLVQFTKFPRGGISLSFNISHAVVDGQSALHFISEWARVARGEALNSAPFLDRRLLRAGEPPSGQPCFRHTQYDPPPLIVNEVNSEKERKKETTVAMLKVSKPQVEALRSKASENRPEKDSRAYTRYEAVSAHVWRSACRARRHVPEQPTALAICVDVRRRVEPPLPEKFFGNAIVDVIARSFSGEVIARPLGYAAGKVRDAIVGVTSAYVRSSIDYLKNLEDLTPLQDIHGVRKKEGPFYGNPNLGVISWMGLPLHGMDFGWGREIAMAPGTHDSDGDSVILPESGGGLVVAICLQVECMKEFKKCFYEEIRVKLFDQAGRRLIKRKSH